jgi:hypothetical protein
MVGLLCTILGVALCLKGLVQWRGQFAARGALLLLVGGATLCWHRDVMFPERWLIGNDKLVGAKSDRREIKRSLHRNVLPLIAGCQQDLARIDNAVAADEDERQRITAERLHILTVLDEAQRQKAEHERTLVELDTAIAGLERERALTEVKDVSHARAAARISFTELRPITLDASPVRSER